VERKRWIRGPASNINYGIRLIISDVEVVIFDNNLINEERRSHSHNYQEIVYRASTAFATLRTVIE